MTWEYSYTVNETEYYCYHAMNWHWDGATGIMVEEHIEITKQTGEYTTAWSAIARIIEPNRWTVPEFPTFKQMLLVLITPAVAMTSNKKSRKL